MFPHSTSARRLIAVTGLMLLSLASATTQAAGRVHLLIVAGQSNAVGYGADASQLPPGLYRPQRDILYRYDIGGIAPTTDFTALRWLSGAGAAIFPEFFGPELSLGRLACRCVAELAVRRRQGRGEQHEPGVRLGSRSQRRALRYAHDDGQRRAGGPRRQRQDGRSQRHVLDAGRSGRQQPGWANAYQANLTAFIAACRSAFAAPQDALRPRPHQRQHHEHLPRCACAPPKSRPPTPIRTPIGSDTDALALYADHLHFTTRRRAPSRSAKWRSPICAWRGHEARCRTRMSKVWPSWLAMLAARRPDGIRAPIAE